MKYRAYGNHENGGYVLITVLLLSCIAAILVLGMQREGISQMGITSRQESLEQALFVAEGGCSLCLSHIMANNPVPAYLSGSIGGGTFSAGIGFGGGSAVLNYTLSSTGFVRGVRRVVTVDYVHSRSWAEYALWYDHYNGTIWFQTGDRFKGKVHANDYLYLQGAPVFEKLLTSAQSTWGSGPASAVFSNSYQLGVMPMTMSSINFTNTASTQDCLKAQANLVLTGATTIAMSGTNLFLWNGGRKWTNYNYTTVNPGVMTDGVIYVSSVGSSTGTLTVAGTLNGRLTLVADGNINITNHIRYASNPSTNYSDDALGLISRCDVVVKSNCPVNLDVYAHIIAEGGMTSSTNDGMFTVEAYDTRLTTACSNLNVYGGIVENYRGPVGTTGGKGYLKNYIFDTRFKTNPPPHYPVVGDQYYWGGWRDSP
ncbi:MAG: hypothetical protein WCO42_03045 [bacterium]